jgi:cytosine/adenosine deaminase-related metal-dependent hydrolase
MDDATARLMAEKGIWLSTQPFLDLGGASALGPAEQAKMQQVVAGTDKVYALARKHGIKTAFGTDILFSKALAERQGAMLAALTRWYTPAEALIMATSTNAELLKLSGPRNPHPGKLGVVEVDALADLLLVDGNPLENIRLIADPDRIFCHYEEWQDLQEYSAKLTIYSGPRKCAQPRSEAYGRSVRMHADLYEIAPWDSALNPKRNIRPHRGHMN